MTTHPEDAMTRERALEDALKPFAREADKFAAEWSWQRRVVTLTWSPDLTVGDFRRAKAALASAQQEPTPAADVEKVALNNHGLLPCPFCGSPSTVYTTTHQHVRCNACFARTDQGTQEKCAELWNKRAAARAKSGEKGGAR